MLDRWAASSRILPTAKKLSENAKRERSKQLEHRIQVRQKLVERMAHCVTHAETDHDVDRLVRACEEDVATARIRARGDDMSAWRESFADEDDGFGPFEGRNVPCSVRSLPLPDEKPRPPSPFSATLFLPPPAAPPGWPALSLAPQGASDGTFLLSAFEAVASHRSAAPFLEPVTGFPEYASAMKQPVCLADLRAQLHVGKIVSAVQLMRMLDLMLANAFIFNAKGTSVWESAEQLQSVVLRELEPLLVIDMIERLE